MKKFLKKCLHLVCNKCEQIQIISTWGFSGLIATLALWAQLTNFSILGYRPTEDVFFWCTLISALIIVVINTCANECDKHKKLQTQKKYEEKLRYYQDTIYNERREILTDTLQELSEKLNHAMQERICIYHYIENERSFECIARYSAHHEYNQLSIRKRYPLAHGIIAHVWTDGSLNGFKRDDIFPDPNTQQAAYFLYLKNQYGIPRQVAKHFRMKAVDIVAEVLRDTKNKPIAVVIFESQRKNFMDLSKIQIEYNVVMKRRILGLLEKLKEQNTPDLKTAFGEQL